MTDEYVIHKVKTLISDSENYEYYIHIDKPMITEDLFNEAVALSLSNQDKLDQATRDFVIKKLFFRNLSKYRDELKIIVPQGFYRDFNNSLWFNSYGQNETVQIHLPETDNRLIRFCHPFIIKLTNEVENNMIKQLANLRKIPFEDRIAENYQMSCDSTLLVAEIINQLLLSYGAYNVSVITK